MCLFILHALLNQSILRLSTQISSVPLSMAIDERMNVIRSEIKLLEKHQHQNNFISVLEIGTWCGEGSTPVIADELSNFMKAELICVDTYKPWASQEDLSANSAYKQYDKQSKTALLIAARNINKLSEKYEIPISLFIGRLGQLPLKEKSFDLIFVDGDHKYTSVKEDIECALDLLKPDGVVIGDDFEVDLPFKTGLVDECVHNRGRDLIFSTVQNNYLHPGIVLALDEISQSAGIKIESRDGCWILKKE